MRAKTVFENGTINPLAICDKKLPGAPTFRVQTFEICTICGARFGIGYHGICYRGKDTIFAMEEWPNRLMDRLAKDHLNNREHKPVIDLDI